MPEDERQKKKVKTICQAVQFGLREDFNGRHHRGEGFTQDKKHLITGHWSIFGKCVRSHAEGEPRGDLPRFQGQTCGACLKAWDDFEIRFQGARGKKEAEVEEVVIKCHQGRAAQGALCVCRGPRIPADVGRQDPASSGPALQKAEEGSQRAVDSTAAGLSPYNVLAHHTTWVVHRDSRGGYVGSG